MTRHPQQPLDHEERALAALLPRPHGRAEPGADLDARILAAAQAALHPRPVAKRQRRSWIGPTAVAASLMLAVGLAWQLRPPPAAPVATEAASADSDVMSMRAIEMPPSTPAPMTQARPMVVPPPEAMVSAPPARDAAAGISAPASAPMPVPVPPPPPAPPAPSAQIMVGETAAGAPPQAAEPVRAQATPMAKASTSDARRERAATSGSIAAESRDEAQRAADAATLDAFVVTDEEEDVPPATADSPEVRDAWLRRIGELLEQDRTVEAKASLAEFKRRYPDATLPKELRELEP